MNTKQSKKFSLLSIAACAIALLFPTTPTAAQTEVFELFETLKGVHSEEKPRTGFAPDGAVRFVGAPAGGWFAVRASAADEVAVAKTFLDFHRTTFGVSSDHVDFVVKSVRSTVGRGASGRSAVRLDQLYDGVPVFGAQALVQVGGEGVEAALLDLLRNTSSLDFQASPTLPDLIAHVAEEIAIAEMVSNHPDMTPISREPARLVVFAPEVLDLKGEPRLSWQVDVEDTSSPRGAFAERLLIDALDGAVLLRYSLTPHALHREVFDAQNSTTIPEEPTRAEGDPATGNGEVDDAYDYAGDTYDFYFDEHGRAIASTMPAILWSRWCATVRAAIASPTMPFGTAPSLSTPKVSSPMMWSGTSSLTD